jgi:hypothetical protein
MQWHEVNESIRIWAPLERFLLSVTGKSQEEPVITNPLFFDIL